VNSVKLREASALSVDGVKTTDPRHAVRGLWPARRPDARASMASARRLRGVWPSPAYRRIQAITGHSLEEIERHTKAARQKCGLGEPIAQMRASE